MCKLSWLSDAPSDAPTAAVVSGGSDGMPTKPNPDGPGAGWPTPGAMAVEAAGSARAGTACQRRCLAAEPLLYICVQHTTTGQ